MGFQPPIISDFFEFFLGKIFSYKHIINLRFKYFSSPIKMQLSKVFLFKENNTKYDRNDDTKILIKSNNEIALNKYYT